MTHRLLVLWLLIYTLSWSLVTVYLDPTVPYDAVEALNWAQNAEWGSPKNPWLPGMVMRPLLFFPGISPHVYWYVTHFLAAAVAMAGTWFLAWQLTNSERLAWFALLTLNLSGLINFDIISYNDNYLLIMLWPWMILFFLRAITVNPVWWLAFAIMAGLATMAKYSTLSLVGAIFISTLVSPRIRSGYRGPFLWLALLIGILLVAPNLVWLWQHDFAAFHWVNSQISTGFNPKLFISLLLIFYPLFILWLILCHEGITPYWPSRGPHRVVLLVYLIPLLSISIWFLFHDGGRLTEWLQPFFILAPAIMVGCVRRTKERKEERKGVFVGLSGVALLTIVGYAGVMFINVANAGQKMSGIIPFSHKMEQLWRKCYGSRLVYVGGDYLAQWLTFYSPSRPQIIRRWNNETKPNIYNAHISYDQIVRHGALLIGRYGESCSPSSFKNVSAEWPQIKIDQMKEIWFQKDTTHNAGPLCIAFVAPDSAGRG